MPKQRKTREEKVHSEYRLHDFKLAATDRTAVKDADEFSYLSSEYMINDLTRTGIFTTIIVVLLVVAKKFLG